MQQAARADSIRHLSASAGNIDSTSIARRGFFGVAALAVVAAAPAAAATWQEGDWLTRWHGLGCGARIDPIGGGLLLAPRPGDGGVQRGVAALFGELAAEGRVEAVTGLVRRYYALFGDRS